MFNRLLSVVLAFGLIFASLDVYAKGYGRSYSSSSRSFSSSRSSSSPSRSYSSSPSKSYSSSPSKSYSSPAGKSYSTSSYSSSKSSTKPTTSSFNSGLSSSGKTADSQKRYVAATTPKATYKTPGPKGVEKPLNSSSPQVKQIRSTVNHDRYVNYDTRSTQFYGSSSPSFFQDSYSPFLMGWILSDALSSQDRAAWAYHHQSDMDKERYEEMLKKDAKLQAEIDALKAQNVTPDPNFVLPQMKDNPDLMYNKEFVKAAYNPVEVEQASSSSGLLWFVGCFFGFVVVCFVVYLFFGHDF